MPIRIRGASGAVRRGYRVAATLGRWELISRHRCEADLVKVDPFEWTQEGPFSLRLALGATTWTYADVTVLRRVSPILVKLTGAPEVR